jgi:hypothetical protein
MEVARPRPPIRALCLVAQLLRWQRAAPVRLEGATTMHQGLEAGEALLPQSLTQRMAVMHSQQRREATVGLATLP